MSDNEDIGVVEAAQRPATSMCSVFRTTQDAFAALGLDEGVRIRTRIVQ